MTKDQRAPRSLRGMLPGCAVDRAAEWRFDDNVVSLLSEGRSVQEVATVTGFRPGYVRLLLKRVYKKLGVSGQVALMPRILAVAALPRR